MLGNIITEQIGHEPTRIIARRPTTGAGQRGWNKEVVKKKLVLEQVMVGEKI